MRQYAREKLRESGDERLRHTRHRDYFLVFAETNVPKIPTRERLIWTRRLKAERENFRQAYELPADQRQEKLQRYQQLPDEKKRALTEQAAKKQAEQPPAPPAPAAATPPAPTK